MFTVEIKINGTLKAHIYGYNVGIFDKNHSRYKYDYYNPKNSDLKKGLVIHKNDDGINKLVYTILEDVEKQKGR